MFLDSPEDGKFFGMPVVGGLTDETVLATMEGACDELAMLDYKAIANLSQPVIFKMYQMTLVVCGVVGEPLTKRYNELSTK